jgi:hypothetical protein
VSDGVVVGQGGLFLPQSQSLGGGEADFGGEVGVGRV